MAFPLGANADLYNAMTRNLGRPPTLAEYNDGVRWVNAATGSNIPLYTETPTAQPATSAPAYATGYNPESGWNMTPGQQPVYQGLGTPTVNTTPATGSDLFTAPGGGTSVDLFNQWLAEQQYNLEQLRIQEEGAMARAQLSANTQLAAAQASAAAQLEAQRIANQGALERLKGQLAESLSQALMTNDMNRANLTLNVAQLAADPRSSVAFMEYLGHAGGGPTAISQNLAAGITPSPVWEYIPETAGPSTQTQQWIDTLQRFIGTL